MRILIEEYDEEKRWWVTLEESPAPAVVASIMKFVHFDSAFTQAVLLADRHELDRFIMTTRDGKTTAYLKIGEDFKKGQSDYIDERGQYVREAPDHLVPRATFPTHVGRVKVRSEFLLTLESHQIVSEDRDGQPLQFGTVHLYKLRDQAGNELVWFSSLEQKTITVGQTYYVTATVKKHDVYKNRQVTVLTRCLIGKEATEEQIAKARDNAASQEALSRKFMEELACL